MTAPPLAPAEPARDPRRIQRALCCMLLDPAYAALVRGDAPLPELLPAERALLRALDPRALGTDRLRRARALHVLLEEHPVSAALLGPPALDRYLSSPRLRAALFGRGSLVLSFGAWLGDQAGGVGRLEAAMARARRHADPERDLDPPLAPPPADLAAAPAAPAPSPAADPTPAPRLRCAPHVVPLIVPDGTLRWYQRARERLGPDPLAALAALARPWPQRPPRAGREHLLVEADPAGNLALGAASPALVALLLAAAAPAPRPQLRAEALRLGADLSDVDDLLDGLLADRLLAPA